MIIKKNMLTLASAVVASALWGSPSVSNVTLVQDSYTRVVTVSYLLGAEPAIVTADFMTNNVSIGGANMRRVAGDVNKLVTNTLSTCTFTWVPDREWTGRVIDDGSVKAVFRVWATNCPPDYMAIDLRVVTNGVSFYADTSSLPYAVTNDYYRHDALLMRKIHAADVEWAMGVAEPDIGRDHGNNRDREKLHKVRLSSDYYIGVFPLTQQQYYRVTQLRPSVFRNRDDARSRPVEGVSYNMYRAGSDTTDWAGWPSMAHEVKEGSVLKKFRDLTGVELDLPTDAQWEYAARAGVYLPLPSGKRASAESLDEIAWYSGNSYIEERGQMETHPVGLKAPNAWGLYDVLGNTQEMVLDYHANAPSEAQVDPPGALSGSSRILRSGTYDDNLSSSYVSKRNVLDPRNNGSNSSSMRKISVRLCCPAVISMR